MEVNCKKCRFWFEEVNSNGQSLNLGQCRKYAPKPVVGQTNTTVRWPITSKDQGCGEFKQQDKGTPQELIFVIG